MVEPAPRGSNSPRHVREVEKERGRGGRRGRASGKYTGLSTVPETHLGARRQAAVFGYYGGCAGASKLVVILTLDERRQVGQKALKFVHLRSVCVPASGGCVFDTHT